MRQLKLYPSDLTDSAWKVIEQMPADKQERKYSLAGIFDILLYIPKTVDQWRERPDDFIHLSPVLLPEVRNKGDDT